MTMVNTELYDIIDDNGGEGYKSEKSVNWEYKNFYAGIPDITTYCDNGRWYIVQSKKQSDM